jgi:hypothetical protein
LGQHHIAQNGDVCIGFRLQPLCLCGGFQLLVVFKLRFFCRAAATPAPITPEEVLVKVSMPDLPALRTFSWLRSR